MRPVFDAFGITRNSSSRDPPHDDVVDDVRVVGVEQMGVLRATGLDPSQVVRERPLQEVERSPTADANRPEVRDVEHDRVVTARAVLLEHARVLDRHVPAAELHHARAERAVLGVERARDGGRRSTVQADSARESRAGAERGGNRSSFAGSPAPATSASCDGGSSPYFTSRCR